MSTIPAFSGGERPWEGFFSPAMCLVLHCWFWLFQGRKLNEQLLFLSFWNPPEEERLSWGCRRTPGSLLWPHSFCRGWCRIPSPSRRIPCSCHHPHTRFPKKAPATNLPGERAGGRGCCRLGSKGQEDVPKSHPPRCSLGPHLLPRIIKAGKDLQEHQRKPYPRIPACSADTIPVPSPMV